MVVGVTPDGAVSTVRKVLRLLVLHIQPSTSLLPALLSQVGAGSFHPSTLAAATGMAVAVGREVDAKLVGKLGEEEAMGEARERIGFL